jgi:hypothetical protein
MPTYRLSEPSVNAKTYPPPRQLICEWCGDWTDEVVRLAPQKIAFSGLNAEELIRRWPHVAEAIEEHEATCPERGRLTDTIEARPRLSFT